ncbi:MAG TPA: class I SAM-dependent methyltransferase [Acidobacteriaceae bacterium]|jgi:SAM-dependent methyltransferase|nr:class I SAM-dependent methyltransferase [Acidobacteriaceae bacterium]
MIANEAPAFLATPAKTVDPRECPICGAPERVKWLTAPDHFHGRPERYQLLRCADCSLVWLDDPPSKAEMGMHYGADYDRTISAASKAPEHWFARRDAVLRLKPAGGSLLDLGCAGGGFLSAMKGPSWKLSGIEMSEDAAAEARRRCGAEVFVGDILDAPFSPGSFDVITCFNVFEHVYEPKDVLVKVAEWLKPGGVFYTLMPNIDSAGARIFGSYWYALELPRHLHHFSPATLRRVAYSAGLLEVSVKTHRELFVEFSTRFLFDDLVKKIGIHRRPLATSAGEPGFIWRVIRKIYRLTLLQLFTAAASLAGPGETIEAVFTKGGAA